MVSKLLVLSKFLKLQKIFKNYRSIFSNYEDFINKRFIMIIYVKRSLSQF